MATKTLLDIVQDILSDADGDEVNNIADTVESLQCARIVRNEFDNIVNDMDIKMQETLTQLTATSSATPCLMQRPEKFHSIEIVWYDRAVDIGGDQRMQRIPYRDWRSFLDFTMSRTESDSEVETMVLGDSGYELLIRNDQHPQFWTILEGYDDIIFDGYDSALETNLQASKSLARGVQKPVLVLDDSSVPDLPENLMNLLLNRSRAFYFDVYKDGVTREVDKRQRNSEVRAQRKKYITKKLEQERSGENFGRSGRHGLRNTTTNRQ